MQDLNIFEYNIIERVAYEVDDAGAFYTGRSWVQRGNVVQHNQFRSIRTRVPVFLGSPSVQGLCLLHSIVLWTTDQLSTASLYHSTVDHIYVTWGRYLDDQVSVLRFAFCDTKQVEQALILCVADVGICCLQQLV